MGNKIQVLYQCVVRYSLSSINQLSSIPYLNIVTTIMTKLMLNQNSITKFHMKRDDINLKHQFCLSYLFILSEIADTV